MRLKRLALAALVSLFAAGCVSLFPKGPPAQLYRFGASGPAPAHAAAPASTLVIAKGAVGFDNAAATDRLLTMTGREAAYIEASRWVSPAPVLFDEALDRTFQSTPGAPRLVDRGSLLPTPLLLNLDVQSFEARYENGPGAAPTVVVAVRATVVRTDDRSVAGEVLLQASKPASDNRVSDIVVAYDAAVQEVLSQLVAWTGSLKG